MTVEVVISASGDRFSLTKLRSLLSASASRTKYNALLHKFQVYARADTTIRVSKFQPERGTWVPLRYLELCMTDMGVETAIQTQVLHDLQDLGLLPFQEESYRKPSPAGEGSVTAAVVSVFNGPVAGDIDNSQANPVVADDDDDETIAEPLMKIRADVKIQQDALRELRHEYAFEKKAHEKALQRAHDDFAHQEREIEIEIETLREKYAEQEAFLNAQKEEAENARQDALQRAKQEEFAVRAQDLQDAIQTARTEYMRQFLQQALQQLGNEYAATQEDWQMELFGGEGFEDISTTTLVQ
ncbi:hypothetical protein C8R45DRAFT_1107494 [Mycena sanguinolenta]|nr:hypothetical protein C8R45DRAFT_1107494 [Mycena sanguinolenta]